MNCVIDRIVIVQLMNAIFIYIICLLIFTFFKKETFRSNTRSIFFTHTLLSNCLYLSRHLRKVAPLLARAAVTIPAAVCVVFYLLLSELTFATSFTLTAIEPGVLCGHLHASAPRRALYAEPFTLFLCLIQLWCLFMEAPILSIHLKLYNNMRFFDYIVFILAPRCLSPLVYGIRDEKFFSLHCIFWKIIYCVNLKVYCI
uniref:G-protein coupled receptors family 1 profile domain-containing protein n=1 Tax=Salmo trutta TaxID=8032 RepID=A0A674EJC9_SALTR